MTDLKKFSAEIRLETLKCLKKRTFGHIGGSLSIVELLSVLYGRVMKYDSKNPLDLERDYFVLSKGHAGPALYATLAIKGFFDRELLSTLNIPHTSLPSHPDRLLTPGVDVTTGSLGQGISVAAGIAQGLKLDHKKNYVYCVLGDGELNEGQVWEALQYIRAKNLCNLILFIDENKKQLDGTTKFICQPFNYVEKLRSFGFNSMRVKGDSEEEIYQAIQIAKDSNTPTCIVLDTIKAQGVKYFEDYEMNHSIRFNEEDNIELDKAIICLENYVYGGSN